jgi:hypothetical protein
MSKEAMKLALEALTATKATHGFREHIEEAQDKAIKALEAALAKQEQGEPVAWFRNEDIFGNQEMEPIFYATKAWDNCQPLYTTPQQPSTIVREPLTDKTIQNALDQAANGSHLDNVPNHNDDSIRMIAWSLENRLENMWARTKLLEHAERLEIAAIKSARYRKRS